MEQELEDEQAYRAARGIAGRKRELLALFFTTFPTPAIPLHT